jgi:hypothetical protein
MRFAILAVVCGAVCGCSSSAYDAAYAKRLAEYRIAAEFAPLRAEPVALADGRLNLRLPAMLVNQLAGEEGPNRSTPPFIREFPGLLAAYEALVDTPEGRFPIVLTVGLVPAGERRKDEVAEMILRQVRQEEEFAKASWQKGREVVDLAGGTRKWDVLELEGDQTFEVEKAGLTADKRMPGRTELWLSADPTQKASVILAFRVPSDAASRLPLPATAALTARSVRLLEP